MNPNQGIMLSAYAQVYVAIFTLRVHQYLHDDDAVKNEPEEVGDDDWLVVIADAVDEPYPREKYSGEPHNQ
jgi:hypothetical protein